LFYGKGVLFEVAEKLRSLDAGKQIFTFLSWSRFWPCQWTVSNAFQV